MLRLVVAIALLCFLPPSLPAVRHRPPHARVSRRLGSTLRPMAVPKQKQSRTHEQAPFAAQDLGALDPRVPAVPQPADAAPVCPTCGTCAGVTWSPLPAATDPDAPARAADPVAVDANGSRPAEVAAGAALAAEQGVRGRCSAPRARSLTPGGVGSSTRPSVERRPIPRWRCARRLTLRSCSPEACGRSARRPLVSGSSTGAALASGLFRVKRAAASTDRLRRDAGPGRARVLLLDVGASVQVRPEHLVRSPWGGIRPGGARRRAPASRCYPMARSPSAARRT